MTAQLAEPRKNSAADDAKKVIGGNWPPYARQGGEATWQAPKVSEKTLEELAETPDAEKRMKEWANQPQPPLMVVPDFSPFELRKAALEGACAMQGSSNDATLFWTNLGAFEEYLRDGTKPS